MGAAFVPMVNAGEPRLMRLFSGGAWSFYALAALVLFVVFPVLNLVVPAGNVLHVSEYTVTLIGFPVVLPKDPWVENQ